MRDIRGLALGWEAALPLLLMLGLAAWAGRRRLPPLVMPRLPFKAAEPPALVSIDHEALSRRLRRPFGPLHLTRSEVLAAARERGVAGETLRRLDELLARCDEAKFSGRRVPPPSPEEVAFADALG